MLDDIICAALHESAHSPLRSLALIDEVCARACCVSACLCRCDVRPEDVCRRDVIKISLLIFTDALIVCTQVCICYDVMEIILQIIYIVCMLERRGYGTNTNRVDIFSTH